MECLLCGVVVEEKDKLVVQKPLKQDLETIIRAAEIRNDYFGKKILKIKDDILNGKIKVKYHKDCRKIYTCKHNIEMFCQTSNRSDGERNIPGSSKTRSTMESFNISEMCLICNEKGTKKKEKLTSIQTEHKNRSYKREIAKLHSMIKRLEIKSTSLDTALKQKSDECLALAALCDDIAGKQSS